MANQGQNGQNNSERGPVLKRIVFLIEDDLFFDWPIDPDTYYFNEDIGHFLIKKV